MATRLILALIFVCSNSASILKSSVIPVRWKYGYVVRSCAFLFVEIFKSSFFLCPQNQKCIVECFRQIDAWRGISKAICQVFTDRCVKLICELQCGGSGMFIPDPGSWFLPIPDPEFRISDPVSKNSNKRGGWKKICCHNFLCSHNFHKIANYFSLDVLKKKIWANFSKNFRTFYPKNCH